MCAFKMSRFIFKRNSLGDQFFSNIESSLLKLILSLIPRDYITTLFYFPELLRCRSSGSECISLSFILLFSKEEKSNEHKKGKKGKRKKKDSEPDAMDPLEYYETVKLQKKRKKEAKLAAFGLVVFIGVRLTLTFYLTGKELIHLFSVVSS